MANALGELFADVAYEIKVKRGEDPRTVKYKPTEFAEKISEISVGIDTSNATATEDDLAQGATAYVNGKKISGALNVLSMVIVNAEHVEGTSDSVNMSVTQPIRTIVEGGAAVTMKAPLSDFGDATAADVAAGKTFTSADGMLVVGTGSGSGGGSGGGSIPSGVYWEQILPVSSGSYKGHHFLLNGELYQVKRTSSSNNDLVRFYKFNENQYTEVLNSATVVANGPGIEFNGKYHFVASDYSGTSLTHYAFDGGSVTKYANLPESAPPRNAFVENGKLKAITYSTGAVYEWNESSDTWTKTSETMKTAYGYLFWHDGVPYTHESSSLYRFEGGEKTKVRTLTYTTPLYYRNGKLYSVKTTSSPSNLYVYDFATDTETVIGSAPKLGLYCCAYEYDGQIRIDGGTDVFQNHLIMHGID
jgi:hypothetical protein